MTIKSRIIQLCEIMIRGELDVGEKMDLLKESYNLLLKMEAKLNEFEDYDSQIDKILIDEINEYIIIKDIFGNKIYYELCDCYTSMIKIIKRYKDAEINRNYERLKKISLKAEVLY